MPRTIAYVFAGRRPNIDVQLPYLRRILDQNPDVELDVWDLARDPADSRYLRSLPTTDRFRVRTEYYQGNGKASRGQAHVWRHYTSPEYRDTVFVKLDDDVVFLDTDRFRDFTQVAAHYPDTVVSALTINNGASTYLVPELWAMYRTLDIPLLEVHLSAEYAERSHRWFLDHWQELLARPVELAPATSWASINAIAYTYQVGRRIAHLLGTRSPERIMDRDYPHVDTRGRQTRFKLGDEGAVNMQPVRIYTGFVAAHLHFGPQIRAMDPAMLDVIRKGYADVARQYLRESVA